MKRSINIENLTVVLALGIILSLLATACGPGKLQTIKNGKFSFSDKSFDQKDSNIIKAVQDKRTADLNEGPQLPVDSVAIKDLAKRLTYVSLKKLTETTASLTIQVMTTAGVPYYITFIEPHVNQDTQNKKTITFSSNIARKILNATKTSETAETLPYSARIIDLGAGQAIVSIYEKTNKKTTEVAAMVRLKSAAASVSSTDKSLEQLKDANYNVRITQLYISNDNVLQGNIEYLDSNSNRVVIVIDSKDIDSETNKSKELLGLTSKIDPNSNSTALSIVNIDESLKTTLSDKTATLVSGDAVIKSDILAIQFSSKKDSSNVSSITLKLFSKKETAQTLIPTTEGIASDKDKDKDTATSDIQKAPSAEDIKAAESRSYEVSTQPVADFSDVTSTVTTVKKPEMKNGLTVTTFPAVIVTGTIPHDKLQNSNSLVEVK